MGFASLVVCVVLLLVVTVCFCALLFCFGWAQCLLASLLGAFGLGVWVLFVCGALPLRVAVIIKVIGCCLIDVGCLPVCDCLV